MIGRLFRAHGEFCASHPWEVIVALLTVTACMLSVDKGTTPLSSAPGTDGGAGTAGTASLPNAQSSRQRPCHGWTDSCEGLEAEYNAADVILMTIVRCSAVLYCYYQFCSLHKLGSKYILGIAGLFTVFSSLIFTTTIIKFLGSDFADLKDALFFLILLIDLRTSGTLAQLALSGTNQADVTNNIARGMELRGPAITLDTIVETLVIGVGTLSGVQRLEILCTFAVLSVVVNYVVFMTFYPACLSLILDLSRNGVDMSLVRAKAKDSILTKALTEEEQKSNPVVQRVKIIMTTGLMFVHIYSRVVFSDSEYEQSLSPKIQNLNQNNRTESAEFTGYIIKWLTMSADQIVILILLFALVVKFIFFENRDEIHDQIGLPVEAEAIVAPLTKSETIPVKTKIPLFTIEEHNLSNQATQTLDEKCDKCRPVRKQTKSTEPPRSMDDCLEILNSDEGAVNLTDEEINLMIIAGHCPLYKLETILGDPERAVKLRRKLVIAQAKFASSTLNLLPYKTFDYSKVMNACCENVLGYVGTPVGYAGPLLLDGEQYFVPMATTEGALVASTNRGCKALSIRGVTSYVKDIGMTRAPCVRFPTAAKAAEAEEWLKIDKNYQKVKAEFDSTSRFGRLKELLVIMDGPMLYIRFCALTGDAMGMNMVSKGTEMALKYINKEFPDMQIIALSGNFCSDKKPAYINCIMGRGKYVFAECVIPAASLKKIMKTDAKKLVDCHFWKNVRGSNLAGIIGGNNAHAANMVTALFIATGQDPAQNVTSSNCTIRMDCCGDNNEDLFMSCTMPSLEVGTVGGGTGLPGQSACLDMLGVRGGNVKNPGDNAKKLATIVCATVMAGELSLMSALVTKDLVKSHMRHNRSSIAVNSGNINPLNSITSNCSTIS